MSDETLWLTNASLVDVHSGEVTSGASLEISAGRIVSVSSRLAPGQHNVVDLAGRFLLPGLISCHSHLSIVFPMSSIDQDENPAVTAFRASVRASQALKAGITTVRCVHEQHRIDLWLRRASELGFIDAPRIFGAGRALSTPGGHGDGQGCVVVSGEGDFYRAGIEELEAGADHLKIFINGGLARAGEDLSASEMTDQELSGVVRAAEKHDSYVVAHSASSSAIRQALSKGVRCFEHAYELDSGTAAELASRGAFLTPTLIVTRCEPWMRDQGFEEATIANAAQAAERHLESIRYAIGAGVALLTGTDIPPGDDVGGLSATAYEMKLLSQAGLGNLGALQSATINPARLLGAEDSLGQAEAGFRADLIAVAHDPMGDLSALGHPDMVMLNGKIVHNGGIAL